MLLFLRIGILSEIFATSSSECQWISSDRSFLWTDTACRKLLAGSADALLNIYQQAMSGSSGFNLSSDDELQLVEGLRYDHVR